MKGGSLRILQRVPCRNPAGWQKLRCDCPGIRSQREAHRWNGHRFPNHKLTQIRNTGAISLLARGSPQDCLFIFTRKLFLSKRTICKNNNDNGYDTCESIDQEEKAVISCKVSQDPGDRSSDHTCQLIRCLEKFQCLCIIGIRNHIQSPYRIPKCMNWNPGEQDQQGM